MPLDRHEIAAVRNAALERAAFGIIALKMRCIDLDPRDRAGSAEFDDAPVVAGAASPLRFPAVAHILCKARHYQIVPVAKKHIARQRHVAAILGRREVDLAVSLFQGVPIGQHIAVNAKPRDAAVRVDLEPQMRHAAGVFDREFVLRIAL